MSNTTGPRSNRNPILRAFRDDELAGLARPDYAHAWARFLSRPWTSTLWVQGATVSEQVFAARVLYRYAAVFGGVS